MKKTNLPAVYCEYEEGGKDLFELLETSFRLYLLHTLTVEGSVVQDRR